MRSKTKMKSSYEAISALLFLGILSLALSLVSSFDPSPFRRSKIVPCSTPGNPSSPSSVGYQSSEFQVEAPTQTPEIIQETNLQKRNKIHLESTTKFHRDPSNIEFVPCADVREETTWVEEASTGSLSPYPFATMLQVSGRYIANHADQTVVFHIPGDLIETDGFPTLIDDIALAWLLRMKIVIVVACRAVSEDSCQIDFDHPHECHNSLRVTGTSAIRQAEEEAGFVRFEIERLLNRSLRRQCGLSPSREGCSGHVVGGNFYSARLYGTVGGKDYEHTGYTSKVHENNIRNALDNNDVVLLTTIASASDGEMVTVNGDHLAASIATSLDAHKLIYMANQGTVLRRKGETEFLQDIPLSLVKSVLDYHKLEVHKAGFAFFEPARQNLEPGAVELLLLLGWASWAVEQGVTRAHIVNAGDGALLEELFTSKHGTNTCLYHDDEEEEEDDEMILDSSDLDSFLAVAAAQNR